MVLYLLSTPIGNLEDISLRFVKTVSNLKYLVVEDTRQSAKLLQLLQPHFPTYQLWPKKLLRADERTERLVADKVLSYLQNGDNVGMLTDAGMPAVADPGSYLVKQVRQANHALEVVPGPSALTAAMSLCGFTAEQTLFLGFWPKKSRSVLKNLEALKQAKQIKALNLVFFDSPLRVKATCELLAHDFPQAEFFVGRELTKKFQTLLWFRASSINNIQLKPKGEYTVVMHLTMI